ncbi:MAG: peptidase T [Lachnospiraceae bacterium]|nr:peptidase T [Lachnospiraceae bacterium]
MRAYERLLKYVKIHTTSDDNSQTVPSTKRQFDLAYKLADEMKTLGISDATVDEHAYVIGHIPATPGFEDVPKIGFIAHLDTAPDSSGENVNPCVHENYDGKDVDLGNGRILSTNLFPHLKNLTGRTLITTDGSTLLGADDKAGIAEIMTMAENVLKEQIPHGTISIAFTPDEEIGHGAELLDIDSFGADFAFTVDGGAENEIEYENFNAAKAVFKIKGISVHPGDAKNRMVNAALLACEIAEMLPKAETPAHTEKREGFYHLTDIHGDVENAELSYIIRDHDRSLYDAKIKTLRLIEKTINERYFPDTVVLTVTEQYKNMIEKIRPHMHIVETAKRCIAEEGLTPLEIPVRGGTDGAQLSFRGLPCPNLGLGGYAYHGPFEHITAEGMDFVVRILLRIIKSYAKKTSDIV